MPYPFAHPAAVLPLAPLLGRFAVPSALVIGSMSPDLWYAVPFASRHLSHSTMGLLFFCLPVSVAAYLLFHLLLKDPCLSLLPPSLAARVRRFAVKGCPRRPPHAVAASFVLGALTHILWDGVTHSHAVMPDGPINWAQHASTLLGSVALAYWLSRKLRAVAPCLPDEVTLSPTARRWAWSLLLSASVVSVAASIADWPSISLELATLKQIARSASAAALQGLALATALYCAAWKLRSITS